MSGYSLTWRGGAAVMPVDGSFLRADTLCAIPQADLERVAIRIGRTPVELSELFRVTVLNEPQLTIAGAPPMDHIGAQMAAGELIIDGDAGDDLGASMRGGVIRVRGNAGHRCGGPDRTSDRGMTGGTIIVDGQAGDHAGLRMRRGMIVALGGAGASPGYRMLAGTVVVGAGELVHPGLEMRRGTIMSLAPASSLRTGPNFVTVGEFACESMPVPMLIRTAIRDAGVSLSDAQRARRYRLWTGDQFELGKGEIWQSVN